MNEFNTLIEKIKIYNPKLDSSFLKKVFDFTKKAHQDHKRLSGDDYYTHPLAVACVLAELEQDQNTIAAGLLHDAIEDVGVTHQELTDQFGPEVAKMVEGVTKLSQLSFVTREIRQAENYRKMFIAMGEDFRIIIIKLADRLHNMRTLSFLPLAKQKATALETQEIYAPLAHRLGVWRLKWELEDLSFLYLEPKKYEEKRSFVMTSDAKIGLILGLVFIFIIAFVINGLPNFWQKAETSELTTNMVLSRNKQLGIGNQGRKVSLEIIEPAKFVQPEEKMVPQIRYKRRLPQTDVIGRFEKAIETKEKQSKPSETIKPVVVKGAVRKPAGKDLSNKKALSRFHIVAEGESLTSIARNFYGIQKGSKQRSISRIFQANRKVLKSPDRIYVGQKLVIPSLTEPARSKTKGLTSGSIFKKVKSIDKGRISADKRKISQAKWYVVQENDSLWRIAEQHLGSGERYLEIVELNAKTLDDEDNLAVGMRLRMPAR